MNNLKIDQAFVRDMTVTPESLQIVKTIVLLANALEMSTIAEGVERPEHLELLRGMRCDQGQGYLFSKPIDAASATDLLSSNTRW
ncbi:MAG: hypothetical protein AMXMBFR84_38940 [Candidatus Hydrogenedentota bacterium]